MADNRIHTLMIGRKLRIVKDNAEMQQLGYGEYSEPVHFMPTALQDCEGKTFVILNVYQDEDKTLMYTLAGEIGGLIDVSAGSVHRIAFLEEE